MPVRDYSSVFGGPPAAPPPEGFLCNLTLGSKRHYPEPHFGLQDERYSLFRVYGHHNIRSLSGSWAPGNPWFRVPGVQDTGWFGFLGILA